MHQVVVVYQIESVFWNWRKYVFNSGEDCSYIEPNLCAMRHNFVYILAASSVEMCDVIDLAYVDAR